jgi:DegV family protein with EDD domain
MAKSGIAIVTDSSANIPAEALRGLDVTVIPLWLHWGEDRFRDGVDIHPPDFYRRLQESDQFPTTSQPSVGEFESLIRRVGEGKDAVVNVLVTSKLSGTVASAQAAAQRVHDIAVHVVDSMSTSMALGFGVLAAARAAAAGAPVEGVVAAAEEMRDRVHLLFAMETLEFLRRGGRISGARWLLGSALQIKPLLHMKDGIVQPLVQVRSKRKALARMLQAVEERLGGKQMAEAAVIDADCPDEGAAIAAKVKQRFQPRNLYRSIVSPVIGTHAGPGTVGIAFYAEA